ncbi:dTMP kinase [Candidatus Saccharibacteria bacterium]|nr:dTMP kinase [Candidatus Saccharibacteria bacterium]
MINVPFFAFEGADGSGKTTLFNGLKALLNDKIYFTREPGGTPVAESIRNVMLDPSLPAMHPITEELLMLSARIEHVNNVVLPKLLAGIPIGSDRCFLSSIVYQGVRGGIGMNEILQDHLRMLGRYLKMTNQDAELEVYSVLPSVIYYLWLPVEESLRRVQGRTSKKMDRLDLEGQKFHKLVHQGYDEAVALLQNNPDFGADKIILIDALQSPEQILAEVHADILRRLELCA